MCKLLPALFLLCACLAAPAHADIIPKDMKPIPVSATIENIGDFTEYTFVQIETLGTAVRSMAEIAPDGTIIKGYKLNQLHILAVPTANLTAGTLPDAATLLADLDIARFEGTVEVGQELVPRDSPISGKQMCYSITTISGGVIAMEESFAVTYTDAAGEMPMDLFVRAFLVTVCVELIVMLLIMRFGFRLTEPGTLRLTFSVIVAQMITLPLLWFLMTRFALSGPHYFLLAEAFAILVEGALYRPLLRLTWRQAMLASLLCNALSVLFGIGV